MRLTSRRPAPHRRRDGCEVVVGDGPADPCVVHQHIEVAVGSGDGIDERLARELVGEVRLLVGAAELVRESETGIPTGTGMHDDDHAVGRQTPGDTRADPRRRAGDKRNPRPFRHLTIMPS